MTQLRGLTTFNGVLFALRGDELYSVDSAGAITLVGTIGSSGGPVDFAANTTQLGIADGTALWVWDGTSLQQVANYVPGSRICVVAQRLVFDQFNSQKFGFSALADMTSIDPLDFFSAERVPDNLLSVVPVYGELLFMGSESGEMWQAVGGTTRFAANTSAYIEYGCAAPFSLQLAGGSCIWLARRPFGGASVMQLQGYQAKAVSTRAIEERFKGRDIEGARAFVHTDGKQEFYCLNVPGVNTTLVYECTFQQWFEMAELVNGEFRQWRPRCHAFAYDQNWFGDNDGNLYRSDHTVHNFAGAVKCRERISPVISVPSMEELGFPSFALMCEKATGGEVMLRYSDDNGANWSNWQTESAGATGKYATRIEFTRLGMGADRVYQVRMTDDAPFNPISAFAPVER
jgi:hypothetical protein